MRNIVFSTLLIFFFSVITILQAQNPYIQNFKRIDYNGANKNWSITQDSLGYIYVGNDSGLLQFNGVSWKLFSLNKSTVVRSVSAVDDVIYTGGYEEFGVWKRNLDGDLTYTSISEKLPANTFRNDDIWKILNNGEKIYFQSFRSIFVYNVLTQQLREITNTNTLFLIKIYNEFWAQKIGNGIYKFDGDHLNFVKNSEIFCTTTVQTILPYSSNNYLIVTAKGLYIYDFVNFTPFRTEVNFTNKEINSAILSTDGHYYIGTILDGIYVINQEGNLINHFNLDNQLIDNTVLSIFEDQSSNIWVGLDKGISCIKRFPSLSFYIDEKNKLGAVYAAKIYNNKLFVGTNRGLYYLEDIDRRKFRSLSEFKILKDVHGQIWDLEEIGGKLYCGTNRDLFVIDSNFKISIPYNLHTGVFDILYDSDNSIYLGTYTSLYRIDQIRNSIIRFDSVNDPIIKLEIDHFGNVWLEHMNKGVYRCKLNIDKTKIEESDYYGESQDTNLPYNLNLFKVGGRAALLGNNKFYIFDDIDTSFRPYNLLDSLFENKSKLNNIYTVDKNRFWIISNSVAYKIFCNGSKAYITNSIDLPFNDISFVNNFEKIISLNDSLDLVCLDKGFILSYSNNQEEKIPEVKLAPPIITALSAINTSNNDTLSYKLDSEVTIPYNYNNVLVSFFQKNSISSNIYFQYKLDGVTEWTKEEKIDKIQFQRLPSGKYTLRLKSINSYGNMSPELQFTFKIAKPWYLSNGAYLIYFLILGFVVYLLKIVIQKRYDRKHRRYIEELEHKKLIEQNTRLESRVKEKDAELLSQTSAIIKKNELMFKVKEELETFNEKNPNKNSKLLLYKINTLLNSNLDSEDDWKSFMLRFEQKDPDFFKKLRADYPELTPNDLKLCACLRLNLESKDIASFMNITVRAVENNRSRLRKKIGLRSDQSLTEFFMSV